MTKINVLRKITCFYPGTLQLPLMKFYPLSSGEMDDTEWAVVRHFKALNIVDYRRQLKDVLDQDQAAKIPYSHDKDTLATNALIGGVEVAKVEIRDPRVGIARNVDRFMFDVPFTELTLLQYFYSVDLPADPEKESIPWDYDATANKFKEAVSFYIKGSGDWTISYPDSLYASTYYELTDTYFDFDIPKGEMRQAVLIKKDQYYDLYRSKVTIEGIDTLINSKIRLDTVAIDNNVLFVSKNHENNQVTTVDLLTKIKRDIHIHKNYKYALLECFTFAETFITEYLTERKVAAGVSKNKIFDISIHYKINVELPVFLQPNETERQIVNRVDKVREKRNKLSHKKGNFEGVTESEALEAVSCIATLYDIINGKRLGN